MVVLAEEMPLAAVVADPQNILLYTCANCFTYEPCKKMANCTGCRFVHYCSRECQIEDWKQFHKFECGFVKDSPNCLLRLNFRIAIAIKSNKAQPAFNGRSWSDVDSRSAALCRSISDLFVMEGYCYRIEDFLDKNNISIDSLFEIYGKVVSNTFLIYEEEMLTLGCGFYIGLSGHEHSCKPNGYLTFRGKKAQLRALDPTKVVYEKNFTVCYRPELYLTVVEQRRDFLKNGLLLECNCERCEKKEWDEWGRSILCTNCEDGYCPWTDDKRPMICIKCHRTANVKKHFPKSQIFTALKNSYEAIMPTSPRVAFHKNIEMYEILSTFASEKSFAMIMSMTKLIDLADETGHDLIAREFALKLCSSIRHYCPPKHPLFASHLYKTAIRFANSKNIPNAKELRLLEAYFDPKGLKPLNFTDAEFARTTNRDVGQIQEHKRRAFFYAELLLQQARDFMAAAFGEDSSALQVLEMFRTAE